MAEEVKAVCKILESVRVDTEVHTDAFKRLLELLGGEFEADLLAMVMTVAAGHSEQHYWTNQTNRNLAKG